jgi:hypothetical protein
MIVPATTPPKNDQATTATRLLAARQDKHRNHYQCKRRKISNIAPFI